MDVHELHKIGTNIESIIIKFVITKWSQIKPWKIDSKIRVIDNHRRFIIAMDSNAIAMIVYFSYVAR